MYRITLSRFTEAARPVLLLGQYANHRGIPRLSLGLHQPYSGFLSLQVLKSDMWAQFQAHVMNAVVLGPTLGRATQHLISPRSCSFGLHHFIKTKMAMSAFIRGKKLTIFSSYSGSISFSSLDAFGGGFS